MLTATSGGSELAVSLFDAKGELARPSTSLATGLADRLRGLGCTTSSAPCCGRTRPWTTGSARLSARPAARPAHRLLAATAPACVPEANRLRGCATSCAPCR
ncbi:hypothetical protein [Nonomuraea sp. JJY05]|uniref:hypothetical protein n=1 Tax=Nonomuraea sp. JJY05 TaxID=3350255 RepID=UPI00373EAF0C